MIKVGVFGATGYAGQQLVWFLNRHKNVEIEFLSSNTYDNVEYSKVYPNFYNNISINCINIKEAIKKIQSVDVIFLALPHGKSFDIVKEAVKYKTKVIDLGADYRLKDINTYNEWYKVEHNAQEYLEDFVYGLCEIKRDEIKNSKFIANPGCYTTASILALYPLVKEKIIKVDSIIIDAKSGVSGAGRAANTAVLFSECNESIKAYGIGSHRHTPEIEQELSLASGAEIILNFTPHLVPMNRGILATCYANLNKKYSLEEIKEIYKKYYKDEYFIRLVDNLPETRNVKGSNFCDIGIVVDKRTNRIIVVSAIDNLIKGAAGQAIQNMNIMMGLNDKEAIDILPMMP
ncbi:N-acetyl-gamma-glutamyl-phosphate reductase [Clostridium grantii]|uniref:N-acetyl-gamma-glutamyl-phosphate reductase n=1 Tax=Clostridium grantii DSM 8605 TaxID=1121316 RepID=A0A1M5XPL2_9CLOT|nr:N-acetyl-gamma-glutamyl-phosphate reductase [Clostridium grantii]SHI01750.1 N-acetyl-gamma-glutamyl-phosphate reductase [Clostridium grantii DSM 8605]